MNRSRNREKKIDTVSVVCICGQEVEKKALCWAGVEILPPFVVQRLLVDDGWHPDKFG